MPPKRVATFALGVLALSGFLVSGCGGSGGGGGGLLDPVAMFVNASPDGSVAFFLNDENKSGTLAPNTGTKFISFKTLTADQGAHDVSLEEPNRSVVYDTQARLFDPGTNTICVAVGLKNPQDGEQIKRLKEIFLDPDRNAPLGNRARLIFVHAFNRRSPFQTPPLILKTAGDNPVFQTPTTAYGESQAIDVDSGTYKFFGNDDPRNNYLQAKDPQGDQVYAENKDPNKPIVLKPGGIYLVLASGLEAANAVPKTLTLVPVEPKAP